jgi:hypothetical protein
MKSNRKVVCSYITAGAIFLVIFLAALFYPTEAKARWMHLMLIATGVSIGWILGIVLSPYTQGEKTKFDSYVKAVAAFLSGYVVAHLNGLIEHMMKPEFFGDSTRLFQVLLFLAAFSSSLVVVYVSRHYE